MMEQKVVLITGGSRGIGREICLMLARSGYYVLINYRSNADEAQRTLEGVRAAGGDGETLRFDVAAGEELSLIQRPRRRSRRGRSGTREPSSRWW